MKIEGLTPELAEAIVECREKLRLLGEAEKEAERTDAIRQASANPYDARTKAHKANKAADEAERRAARVYRLAFDRVAMLVLRRYDRYSNEQLINPENMPSSRL